MIIDDIPYIPIVIEKYSIAIQTLENIAAIEFFPDENDKIAKNIVDYAKVILKSLKEMPEDQITKNLIEHRKKIEEKICEVKK